jgi:hypothetical protein
MPYEEEDVCMSYEEEDTCLFELGLSLAQASQEGVSVYGYEEEEDTCISYEEKDTCLTQTSQEGRRLEFSRARTPF